MTDKVNANRCIGTEVSARGPGGDWLGFEVGAEFQPNRVAEWLEPGPADLSRLADVPQGDAVSAPMRQHLTEVAALCNLIAELFEGDLDKAQAWFKAVNPLLGDVAPRDMVRLGRFERLRMFIGSSLHGR